MFNLNLKFMKKNAFYILSLFILCLSTNPCNSKNPNSKNITITQEQTLKAYIYWQEEWHQGYITISNGILTNYQFSSLEDRIDRGGRQLTGYFQANERFVPLNQNSQLAIKYNFTHYVDFRGYRAYIIAN